VTKWGSMKCTIVHEKKLTKSIEESIVIALITVCDFGSYSYSKAIGWVVDRLRLKVIGRLDTVGSTELSIAEGIVIDTLGDLGVGFLVHLNTGLSVCSSSMAL